MSLTVIIPAMPHRYAMLAQAIISVRAQHVEGVTILVACDQDAAPPEISDVEFIHAPTQAAKVNLGIEAASTPIVAFLHDDDLWRAEFLQRALKALAEFNFVSSTSLEIDEAGGVIGVVDCAVPSGWVLRREMFKRVGPWLEEFPSHPDSEWLGRLGLTPGVKRVHLIDKLAPEPLIRIGGQWRHNRSTWRPGFRQFLDQAQPTPVLVRHPFEQPLVTRRQFSDGIMQRINEPERYGRSQWEYQQMMDRYNRIPW